MGNCTLIIAFALICIRPNAGMGAPIVLIHYGLKNLIAVSYIIMITNTNIIIINVLSIAFTIFTTIHIISSLCPLILFTSGDGMMVSQCAKLGQARPDNSLFA